MKQNMIVIAVATLIVGSGIGFFGGMQYQKSQRQAPEQFASGQFAPRGTSGLNGARSARNGGGVTGEIISRDERSLTVKLPDGSSKIVLLTSSTSINKAATASATDLVVGSHVAAYGSTNTDGSMTASNVQLDPPVQRPNGSNGPPSRPE